MTPEEQAREIVWVSVKEIDGGSFLIIRHSQDIERRVAAALAERDREIATLNAEIGNAGSPPPEGSWKQRLFAAEREIERLKDTCPWCRMKGSEGGHVSGCYELQLNALRTQRDALVKSIENWRKVATRILDGETEAVREFEDAGIVLDAALAAGKGEP